jgi:predicted kinase
VADRYQTCVVLILGYPGVGKRTVGSHLAERLDGVLVDNQLINIPLLTLFKWDGKFPLPAEIWERVAPIREAVLGTIEDLAPKSNSYVFTTVLEDGGDGASQYDALRSLARRRGSLFLSVMLTCDIDEQVRRIDAPDRIARLKGSDPEGYRRHRQHVQLFEPPPEEVVHLDTTEVNARQNAEAIYDTLVSRRLERRSL